MSLADHNQLGLACNPNVYPKDDVFNLFQGPFSMKRRCFVGYDTNKFVFDYALDFHKKYKGKAKFSYNVLMDAHEWTTFVP